MGFRITTWNVNGIRNPFSYQPWRDQRTFASMFDLLEADIVVFQETKIQRKDLSDDMVLVPGWDCFWSLPRHKKGYSGVVIYTRQSKCAPIRAEEGISGLLCPPNSSTNFTNQPEEIQIGGYPSNAQLASSEVDASTLDSEGRCVILEFPAFVLLGVYCPAARDETRDEFRIGFINLLDARLRNLAAIGKRIILTGDLNISREPLDNANPQAAMRKNAMTAEEYLSTPSRRFFNHLLDGGKIIGERDHGREMPIMLDICRAFHPTRPGMFTCWEQKVNARPGNHGSRIDYVLCSLNMRDWFSDSNIQEGLMGSDHCPVYAVLEDKVLMDGTQAHLLDFMNPTGMFLSGKRQRENAPRDMLPLSGKLIPEFDGRRSIRDMFTRKRSAQKSERQEGLVETDQRRSTSATPILSKDSNSQPAVPSTTSFGAIRESPLKTNATASTGTKRSMTDVSSNKPLKRSKSGSVPATPATPGKGQQSLKGFFKPQSTTSNPSHSVLTTQRTTHGTESSKKACITSNLQTAVRPRDNSIVRLDGESPSSLVPSVSTATTPVPRNVWAISDAPCADATNTPKTQGTEAAAESAVHDPIVSKESWSRLFSKPVAPRCEGHDEPCKTLLTKKSGMNCGRSFWMCARPLGLRGRRRGVRNGDVKPSFGAAIGIQGLHRQDRRLRRTMGRKDMEAFL